MHISFTQSHESTQGHEDHTFTTGLLGSLANCCKVMLPMLHYAQYGALFGDTLTSRRLQGQAIEDTSLHGHTSSFNLSKALRIAPSL